MSGNSKSILNQYRRWRRYRDTLRELNSLTSRELDDLGITRGDIGRVAREAARM